MPEPLEDDICKDNRPERSPETLCHVVLRTTPDHFDAMIQFYLVVLGGRISHRTPRLCFIGYDHEHHRLALVADPDAQPRNTNTRVVGLHHMAFGFPKLVDLAVSYEQKKAAGILPDWCINHGMTISMYYFDPDGNQVEFQVDTFPTAKEAVEYMKSAEFGDNPIGVDYDPEDFCKAIRSGQDEALIKVRPNIGRRDRR